MELIYDWTDDGLRLQAGHWLSNKKDICVIFIHGMGGNIIENYFATVWGNMLEKEEIGFIYGHNRGYSHVNDILTKNGNYKRIGTTYEMFEECIYDIDLWIKKAKELGYKKIILLGHSFGCNKSIYYLYKKNKMKVNGLILASPPDIQGLLKLGHHNYEELMKEALENIKEGYSKKIVGDMYNDWNYICSETFLDWFKENSPCDNIPILRDPDKFFQLATINIPILAFSGEKENDLYKKLDLLKEKAILCPDFKYEIIRASDHIYTGFEQEVGKLIINWLNTKI